MPNPRLTQIIAELPFERKIVGVGSILMLVSLFFPWYQDLDSFRTGDTFTGLTGPMYFAGFTFLVIAGLSITALVMDHFDRKLPLLKIKTARLHLVGGVVSFYLLLLIGSVYFHPAFGVNITLKQSGFGMFIAYAAAALLTLGGYLEGRGKAAIQDFENETREQQTVKIENRKQEIVSGGMETKVVHPMIERKPRENIRSMQQAAQHEARRQQMQQPAMDLDARVHGDASAMVSEKAAEVSALPTQKVEAEEEHKTQPYRMDL